MGTMGSMGAYARDVRERLGKTQKEVAEVAGTSPEYLSQIEGGKPKLPRVALRRGIAKALGIRHIDLLIAAGELRPDEIPTEGAKREPFPESDPRAYTLRLLESIKDPHQIEAAETVRVFTKALEGLFPSEKSD